jgi:glutaryl-CoA dehydrogenase
MFALFCINSCNEYWERAEFPYDVIPKLTKLDIMGGMIKDHGCPGLSPMACGLVSLELSRGDGSIASIFGIQTGLVMNTINLLGNESQREEWLPVLRTCQKLACFALTEPHSGSNAFSFTTTARRVENGWVLNGTKRWIGNAGIADVALVWAREENSRRVSCFLIDTKTPGYKALPMLGRLAKRCIINCDVYLDNCFVPDGSRLENANRFRDITRILLTTRSGCAWESLGHAMAAYEIALDYAKKREPFGKPIASYQLVQDKLVQMLAAISAMQMLLYRASQLYTSGKLSEGQASLLKVNHTKQARMVVSLACEVLGGNGILWENHVARHMADMEAVHTYEGTAEIHTLIVGRDITGISALL